MANFEDFSPIFCPTADFLSEGGGPKSLYNIHQCKSMKLFLNHKQVNKTIKCESCGESFNYKAYYSIELEFCPGKL